MNNQAQGKFIVSVWMVAYNHENYIAQAIEGVLMQKTNFPIELIIGEDCSTDNTPNIIKAYAERHPDLIKARFNKSNTGMIANVIKTLNECKGDYIAMCEGDDYWTSETKLQKQIDFLESNKDYSICFHPVEINENNILVSDYITNKVNDTTDITDLIKNNFMHTPSVVFRRNWHEVPNLLNNCQIADYIIHLINAQYGKIKRINEIMSVYRVHNDGLWSKRDYHSKLKMFADSLKCLIGYFNSEIDAILKDKYSNMSWYLFEHYDKIKDKNYSLYYFTETANNNPRKVFEKYLKLKNSTVKITNSFIYRSLSKLKRILFTKNV